MARESHKKIALEAGEALEELRQRLSNLEVHRAEPGTLTPLSNVCKEQEKQGAADEGRDAADINGKDKCANGKDKLSGHTERWTVTRLSRSAAIPWNAHVRFVDFFPPDVLRTTAARMSALNAFASISSPS